MNTPGAPTKTVLVVDDEPAIVEFLSHILASEGFNPLTATSVPEAIKAFSACGNDHPALSVLDIAIHKDNGIALAHELLKRSPNMAILFISGYVDDLVLLNYLPAGTKAAFLQKVFTHDQFTNAVHSLLSTPKPKSGASR